MTQTIATAEQNYNESRHGQWRYTLIKIAARDRISGAVETARFWTGPYDQSFTVDGDTGTYIGAGAALDVDDIPGGTGFDIRYISVRLATTDDVNAAIREYDPRLAPVEIYTVAMDLNTGEVVSPPRRIFKGAVNETPITTPAEGGDAFIEITLASSAREMTRTLPLYRSDSEMRRRSSSDRFREAVSTTGLRQVAWGEKQVRDVTVGTPTETPIATYDPIADSSSWGP